MLPFDINAASLELKSIQSEIPFELNTGYIMNNRNKLPHKMKHPVPPNQTRYSVYALFDYV